MDTKHRLRQHLGESARIIHLPKTQEKPSTLIDFAANGAGEAVTLIEVGEHGIVVEFVHSGHKSMLTFDEVEIHEDTPKRSPSQRKTLHHSGKAL